MLTVIVFVLILSILVLIHELGHFSVAKKAGIYVEEFGLGLPPRVWGIKKGETIYSLNLLPFGGFVRMYGEDEIDEPKSDVPASRAFVNQSPWVRLAVTVAGVSMNLLLGIFLFSLVYSFSGVPDPLGLVQVLQIQPDSPAATAGLQPEDVIAEINELTDSNRNGQLDKYQPTQAEQFVALINQYQGQPLQFTVWRDLKRDSQNQLQYTTHQLTITPRANPQPDQGALGVIISQAVVPKFYLWYQMPFVGAYYGIKEAWGWMLMILAMLKKLVFDLFTQSQVPKDVAGPVGIYQLTGEVVKFGWLPVLRFAGILSINLAVMNILPLPALDGGRLWFILAEAVTGKRWFPKAERYIHSVGMLLLIGLLLLVTVADIHRIWGEQLASLWTKIKY